MEWTVEERAAAGCWNSHCPVSGLSWRLAALAGSPEPLKKHEPPPDPDALSNPELRPDGRGRGGEDEPGGKRVEGGRRRRRRGRCPYSRRST